MPKTQLKTRLLNNIENLQPDYDKQYQLVKNTSIQHISEYLNTFDGKTVESKVNELRKFLAKKILTMLTKWSDELKIHRTDLFTDDLINSYNEHIGKYENRDVSFFIHYHLADLKALYADTVHEYPHNYQLTPQRLVKLIARHNALKELKEKLYPILGCTDTAAMWIEKLTIDKPPHLIPERSLDGQKSNQTSVLERKDEVHSNAEPLAMAENNSQNTNPYPRIFKNHQCYLFFTGLQSDIRERFKLADYSFIYRRMQKDGYIFEYVVDTEFRDFLSAMSIYIEKTKLLDYCKTDLKEKNYFSKKALFKPL